MFDVRGEKSIPVSCLLLPGDVAHDREMHGLLCQIIHKHVTSGQSQPEGEQWAFWGAVCGVVAPRAGQVPCS